MPGIDKQDIDIDYQRLYNDCLDRWISQTGRIQSFKIYLDGVCDGARECQHKDEAILSVIRKKFEELDVQQAH